MFVDYDFYTSEYGGKLSEDDFNVYVKRASYYIDSLTLGKASKYIECTQLKPCCDRVRRQLAMACSAATEIMASTALATTSAESSGSAVYQSETVGAHSVSYRTGADVDKTLKERINGILGVYLAGTGLLYKGIPVCIHRMR